LPVCTLNFVDVPPANPFYSYVEWMACRSYISGYPCGGAGEPCPGNYFRPGLNVTRGQLLKMVVNASGWSLGPEGTPPPVATFADVPPSQPFFVFVETGAAHGIVGGYACGGAGEPCDAQHRPYFRPANPITRGQLSKVIALARGYPLPAPAQPTFEDVPAAQPFFGYIEAMAAHGIVAGYSCGGSGEPCDPAQRPYFRPASNATRGQVTKFVTSAYRSP
jgi:S-layer family protein